MYFYINNLKLLGYQPTLVIDVGAFRGEWTKNVLPIFPGAKFIMIEPQEDKTALLADLAARESRVHFIKTLVGKSKQERVTFYEMESGSSVYEEQTNHPRDRKEYSMRTLDDAIKAYLPADEIFLKMDVQGAELDVLEGAEETLARCNFVLLEASLLNYNRGAPQLAEVIRYLDEKGFVVFDCCDMRREKNGVLFQVDFIFTRKESVIRQQVDYKG